MRAETFSARGRATQIQANGTASPHRYVQPLPTLHAVQPTFSPSCANSSRCGGPACISSRATSRSSSDSCAATFPGPRAGKADARAASTFAVVSGAPAGAFAILCFCSSPPELLALAVRSIPPAPLSLPPYLRSSSRTFRTPTRSHSPFTTRSKKWL